MKTRSAIYKIENTLNGKFYVGSALNAGRRKIEHWRDLRRQRHANRKLQSAWDKDGEAAFTFSVLEWVADPADLITREQHWIDALGAVSSKGYNLAPNARSLLGFKMSEETRARMSQSASGKIRTPEHAEKLRQALLGRKMTEEQCEKMRLAKLGKKRGRYSEEHRAKMSAAARGRPKSAQHKASLAAANRGKKWSPEQRAKFLATMAAKRQALSTSA